MNQPIGCFHVSFLYTVCPPPRYQRHKLSFQHELFLGHPPLQRFSASSLKVVPPQRQAGGGKCPLRFIHRDPYKRICCKFSLASGISSKKNKQGMITAQVVYVAILAANFQWPSLHSSLAW